MKLISLREIRERLPRSRSTIYAEISRKIFPKPIKIGRGSYWREDEIEKLLAAYSADASPAELAALCDAIHQHRLNEAAKITTPHRAVACAHVE